MKIHYFPDGHKEPTTLDVSFEVLHALPGRVRLRIPETKNNRALADAVAQLLIAKRGVKQVRANTSCGSVVVSYDDRVIRTFVPEKQLRGLKVRRVSGANAIAVVRGGNGNGSHNGHGRLKDLWRRFSSLIVPTAAMGITLFRHALPVAPMYAIVAAAAAPVFHRAGITMRRERRLGVDFLDATAIAIMGIQRNLPTCAFMAWLIGIGEHIREETARKSQKAIAELVEFNADLATLLVGRKRVRVRASELRPGDRVVANAGDVIAVDGTVVSGRAGVDQTSLTGESALAERSCGDRVFAGSLAVDGELVIKAEAVGLNTRAGRIVQMLRSAPVQETRIEDYAARFADRLVLPTFAASGAVFALSGSVARALSMLIVDFGTGVRVAAPTAFLSSMAHAAHKSIVIKGGRAMEKLAGVDTVVFDKTGTLTTGLPEVKRILLVGRRFSEKGLLRLAAAAEAGLNHPVANALASKAMEVGVRIPGKVEARLRVGMGVKAVVEGKTVLVGSGKLMADEGVDLDRAADSGIDWRRCGESPLYVAVEGRLSGIITYADKVRSESAGVVLGLRELGVKDVMMLTGDREVTAMEACADLGIDTCLAEMFPDKKLEFIRQLRSEGRVVAVVGDGINDSLALAHADVAVAPAGATDAAKEAADVLLMEDDLRLLVEAFTIARAAVNLVRQNYQIVAVPNAGAIALAATGLLGPPGATLINNGSTVAAGLNGLRPLLGNGRRSGGGNGRRAVCAAQSRG